jgi:hypothetical protein
MRLILKGILVLSLLISLPAWGEQSRIYNDEEVRQALHVYIQWASNQNEGEFKYEDEDRSNRDLKLELVKIHSNVKKLGNGGYLSCADFKVANGPSSQLYDIDFWLFPNDAGHLVVKETKVHKEPVYVSGKWTKKTRYTFIN